VCEGERERQCACACACAYKCELDQHYMKSAHRSHACEHVRECVCVSVCEYVRACVRQEEREKRCVCVYVRMHICVNWISVTSKMPAATTLERERERLCVRESV